MMNFIGMKPEATKASATPRELSAVARAIAAEPVANAISPVVLTGVVRLAEFLGVAAIGTATYTAYVYPHDEPNLIYAAAILLISAAAVLAFQAFEIYNIAAFRSHIHQLTRLALAWTLVFRWRSQSRSSASSMSCFPGSGWRVGTVLGWQPC
jgi:hypothetical protein